MIDLPGIYHLDHEKNQEFFEALSKTEWMNLLLLKPIQKTIEFNYKLVKEYSIKKLFIPFAIFQLFYVTYFNFVSEKYENYQDSPDSYSTSQAIVLNAFNIIFILVLFYFSFYFAKNEVVQLIQNPLDYLQSIWNYIDIIPPIGIFVIVVLDFLGVSEDITKTI